MGAVENITAPESGKLCAQYLGPALRLLNFNNLPLPVNPFLTSNPPPYMLRYTDSRLMPDAEGQPPPPATDLPAVSAYTGARDVPPPPGYGPLPGPQPGAPAAPPGAAPISDAPTVPDLLLPAERPQP
jgi:phospholipid/cholesterol/gamma-HCH transport system substrate-binding protein